MSSDTEYTSLTEADLVPLKVGSWIEILVFVPLNSVLAALVILYGRKLIKLQQRPFLKNREPKLALALCYGFTLRSVLSATQICFPGAWICGIYRVLTGVTEALCFSTFLLRLLALYFRFLMTKYAVVVSRFKESSSPWKSWILRKRTLVVRSFAAIAYSIFAANAIGNIISYFDNKRPEAGWIWSGEALCYVVFAELYNDYDIRMLIAAVCLGIFFSLMLWSVKENYKIKQELFYIAFFFALGVVVRGLLLLIPGSTEVVLTWFDFSSMFVVTLPCYALFYFSLYRPLQISDELAANQHLASASEVSNDNGSEAKLLKSDSEVVRERNEVIIQSIRLGKKPEGVKMSSKIEGFLAVLQDEQKRKEFEQFLLSEFAIENLLFYQDVVNFRKNATKEEARRLYDTYISENSPLEINISSKCKLMIDSSIDSLPASGLDTFYDEASLEILRLMHRDSFLRFQMTAHFRRPTEVASIPTPAQDVPSI